jgi:YihY family inner membrane protein
LDQNIRMARKQWQHAWRSIRESSGAKKAIKAFHLFGQIEAEQRAASFAYYALFSLFPLVALMLTAGSLFFPADEVISLIEHVAPLGAAQQELIWQTVATLEKARGSVSLVSLGILLWASMRFFQALVRGVNRAWHTTPLPWWQMPLKNLVMLAVLGAAMLLGLLLPAVVQGLLASLVWMENYIRIYFPDWQPGHLIPWMELARLGIAGVVLFGSFGILYMLAPRRRIRLREVWVPAAGVSILLILCQSLFVNFLPHVLNYNRIYGAVGGLMFLLMWIYISGMIILAGACACVAMNEELLDSEQSEEKAVTPSTQGC